MIREKEIQLFSNALTKANEEFFLDAIPLLEQLIVEFPDSELIDDALYDIGLCYFFMNQFEKALEYFFRVVNEFPEATITILTGGNEYGYTAAKSLLAIVNCYLGLGRQDLAVETLKEFDKFPNSYLVDSLGLRRTFKGLAKRSLKVYKETEKK